MTLMYICSFNLFLINILSGERARPYKSIIPAGSTKNNVGDRVVDDVISKCTWNINVMQDQLLSYDLKWLIN